MNREMVITESDLRTRFHNERDLVTLSPYRVGDRVVRCSSCRTIVKSEFVMGGCPICGHAPFLPAQVNTRPVEVTTIGSESLTTFLWLLLLSAAASLLPYAFPAMTDFIYEATFGIGLYNSMLCVIVLSMTAAVITYNNRKWRRMWQESTGGAVLLLIPVGAPYLVLAAIWAVILIIAIIIIIACTAFVIGLFASVFE